MPLEQRDEPRLQVAVETADRGVDLTPPELLRSPKRVVPEVAARARVKAARSRLPRRLRVRRRHLDCGLEAELVVQHAIPAFSGDPGLGQRRELPPRRRLEQCEVHVLARARRARGARRGRRTPSARGTSGQARRTPPPSDAIVGQERGLVDEEADVEIRTSVSAGVPDRACEPTTSDGPHVHSRSRAQSAIDRSEEIHPRVDVEKERLVDVEHRRVHASQRELATRDPRLEVAGAASFV